MSSFRIGRSTFCALMLALMSSTALVAADPLIYRLGDAIDFPCIVSSPDNSQPRTIILPATLDKVIDGGWNVGDLEYQGVNNTVSFQLKNPALSATIQVYDVTGQLYLVSLRAAAANETPEPSLTIVNAGAANGVGESKRAWPKDTDSATAILGRAMVSGVIPDGITVAPFSSNVDGKVVTGKTLFEDDLLEIRVMRMWIASNLKGYELLWTWKGDRAVRLDVQRLYFPGLIAIHSADQDVGEANDPFMIFRQKSTSLIHLICVP